MIELRPDATRPVPRAARARRCETAMRETHRLRDPVRSYRRMRYQFRSRQKTYLRRRSLCRIRAKLNYRLRCPRYHVSARVKPVAEQSIHTPTALRLLLALLRRPDPVLTTQLLRRNFQFRIAPQRPLHKTT